VNRVLNSVAALYDVHGNLPALESVLADPRCAAADAIVSGGDVCAGPFPVEAFDLLERHATHFVRGNADRELRGWPSERLSPVQLETLRAWPTTVTLDVDGLGEVVFCHGSPRSDDEILTRITPVEVLDDACGGAALVVGGHTHVQYDRTTPRSRIVNAGSVGMPYEGRTAAYWLLLGPEVELVSTEYDVEAAVAAIRDTDYPEPDRGNFLESLLEPHSAEEATSVFEAQRGA
jgi:predicted phosphodiesterase